MCCVCREFNVREGRVGMVAEESFQTARIEHLHVCHDCYLYSVCSVHSISAPMFPDAHESGGGSSKTSMSIVK